jgi:hypothetical protein
VDLAGNDRYETPAQGLGYSINRSVAMLVDAGGDDVYRSKNPPGTAPVNKRYSDLESRSLYWVEAESLGLFLDLGGNDDYGEEDRNGSSWGDPPESENVRVRNRSVGMDVEEGKVDWRARPLRTR